MISSTVCCPAHLFNVYHGAHMSLTKKVIENLVTPLLKGNGKLGFHENFLYSVLYSELDCKALYSTLANAQETVKWKVILYEYVITSKVNQPKK